MKRLIFILYLLFCLTSAANALPKCEDSWSVTNWDNCFGTYTYANGNKYEGDYKDNKMHGQGTFTFANGSKDVGTFENDKLNGYAITYYANGNINQEGIFKDDKFLYTQKKSKIDKHKDFCEEIGFTPKTADFGNCVLELMKKD